MLVHPAAGAVKKLLLFMIIFYLLPTTLGMSNKLEKKIEVVKEYYNDLNVFAICF